MKWLSCFFEIGYLWMLSSILGAGIAQERQWQVTAGEIFPPQVERMIRKAIAIDVDASGNIYIVDRSRHQVLKFSPAGVLLKQIGGFGNTADQLDDPRDVYAGAPLNVYVADYNNHRVLRYDQQLNFLNHLSSHWPEPYHFEQVKSIAVSSQNDLFLLEDGRKRIIKFSRTSRPTVVFGGIQETFGQLLEPTQITLEGNRRVFVSDPAQAAVVVFDYLGNFLTRLEHPLLQAPQGIHWGADQQLYVTDRVKPEIFIFSKALAAVGRIALGAHCQQTLDVAVCYDPQKQLRKLYVLFDTGWQIFYLVPKSGK